MKLNKINLIIFFLFFILTAVLTYPLVLKINGSIPGFHSTDETYGALWNFWWLKYVWQNHLSYPSYSMTAIPFGTGFYKNTYLLWDFINKWFSILTNNIFTYNTEILFSFFASAIFMYYLVYYLNGNRVCSVLSAIIYAFCPYHFARAWQHLGLAQIQWMPIYILMLFKLKDKPNLKYAIFVALAFFFVFSFDIYYAYFMFMVTLIFILFLLIYNWRLKTANLKNLWKIVRMLSISGILVFLLTLPSTYLIFKNRIRYSKAVASAHNPYLRQFEDLFAQSAKPLSYLLPATTHPIFGKFTENFIGSSLYGESFTEHTLYLGWISLLLAFVAFRKWRRNRKLRITDYGLRITDKENFYISFFVFLAIVAWLFSQPPWWKLLGFKLYTPSFFIYKALPMFRAYCRFGIVVMLAVAVLAGFGLKIIISKLKTQNSKLIVTTLFCGLVFFEFWNWPPFKVIDVSKVPQVYYWLKEQTGDFTIAEYPLDAESTNELYKFFQTKHEKKIINGTIPETYANQVSQTIKKLSEPKTAGRLKGMGVRYALVHRDGYLETELIEEKEELDKIPHNPGLKLVRSFPAQECPRKDIMCVQKSGPIDVYEVVAESIEISLMRQDNR